LGGGGGLAVELLQKSAINNFSKGVLGISHVWDKIIKVTGSVALFCFLRTFIIERQPPQVLKKETKFGVVIR